jgi:HK97 gp10 family phage protein
VRSEEKGQYGDEVIRMTVIVTNRLPEVGRAIERKAESLVRDGARDIVREAQARAPVLTGALRGSISTRQKAPLEWEVVAEAEHAVHVEYGTVFTRAHPFMTPAHAVVAPKLKRSMRDLV